MALIDYKAMTAPYIDPAHDPIDAIMYRGANQYVDTVLVNGKVVVKGGCVTTIDEGAIGKSLAEAASRPRTDQEKALMQAMDTLKAQVKKYYKDWSRKVDVEPYFTVNSEVNGLKK